MYQSKVLRICLLVFLTMSATFAVATELILSATSLGQLAHLKPAEQVTIAAFPIGANRTTAISFERVDIYSPDARMYVISADGQQEIPRSQRIFLRGYSSDGSARVALSLNPDFSIAEGNGFGPEGSFVLNTGLATTGANKLTAQSLESSAPSNIKLDFKCGNEFANLDLHQFESLAHQLRIDSTASTSSVNATSAHALRLATVGVDTDSLFMANLFSNNTTSAANWIGSMFNAMNTMYERDLVVRLLQGTTFYRTSSATDPYTTATGVPANGTDLNIFGSYWQNNYSQNNPNKVTRAFATLLSGRGPCSGGSCSASGIAWINAYCQTASSGGSYSVVQVFSSATIDPNGAIAARLTGHEIGHNFGASHTHCTNATTGATNVATNTIDQCYNGESAAGCYAGATSCPTTGPGAPAGTIMSYCNTLQCNSSGPSKGQNVLQFHPTQITVLSGYINSTVQNQPTCLNATDDIFYSGFD